jgi:outer membrane protein TolC
MIERPVTKKGPTAMHANFPMRSSRLALAVLLLAAATAGAGPDLDLRECYERALARNERVGIAAAEWRAAEARRLAAGDTWLPSVSLAGSAAFQNDRRETSDSDSSGRAPERYEARVRAEQPLYRGFRTTRLAESLEAQGRAARFDERRAMEVLYLDVSDAFHQLLLFERDLALLDRLAEVREQLVAALEDRVAAGRSRKADLLGAKTELAELRVDQAFVRGQAAAARETLSFLIDLPADAIRLRAPEGDVELPGLAPYLERAAERADIQAGIARAEAAKRAVQEAQGERQPELLAAGNLYLLEDPDEDREWNVTLTMDVPIFDDGAIRGRTREQTELHRISELNLAALRRSAQRDVRSAFDAFIVSASQRERLNEARELARENYELQQRDYEGGRASQLDALTALAQWQNLERRASAAEVQTRANLVRLHVAAGEVAP